MSILSNMLRQAIIAGDFDRLMSMGLTSLMTRDDWSEVICSYQGLSDEDAVKFGKELVDAGNYCLLPFRYKGALIRHNTSIIMRNNKGLLV